MIDKTKQNHKFFNIRFDVLICLFLIITTLVVYWQVTDHTFISFDDNVYVTENAYVQGGLSKEGIGWAFSFHHESGSTYWHPLAWLSHMSDYQLFGLNPGWHHFLNLIFHIANSILLFIVIRKMTGAPLQSFFVSVLFAIHPVNVDSVAWVAERKNLLSTFFWLLTMYSYSHYSERPRILLYLLTCFLFILGLLAKPMLATLPFVLLLFDYWPLKRFRFDHPIPGELYVQNGLTTYQKSTHVRLIFEKLPFMAFSAVAIYISTLELKTGGHLIPFTIRSLELRIANFLVSYITYIENFLWPSKLAILYPYPTDMISTSKIVAALFILLCVTIITLVQIKNRPFLIVGWLWYLGTLVSVSGLIQGGVWPAMADRWAYVPFIGLYIMVSWGVPSLIQQWRFKKVSLTTASVLIFFFLSVTAWIQVGYWKNDLTLFQHAVEVTKNNYIAHNNLGLALEGNGMTTGAISHYKEALKIKPDKAEILGNLGIAYAKNGGLEKSAEYLRRSIQVNPRDEKAHINLSITLSRMGKHDKAIKTLKEALNINPLSANVYYNLGIVLAQMGRNKEAIGHYEKALQINPHYLAARINLANTFVRISKIEDALFHYSEVVKVQPHNSKLKNNIKILNSMKTELDKSIESLNEVVANETKDPFIYYKLGLAYQKKGHFEEALSHYNKALSYNQDFMQVRQNMALTYSIMEDYEHALSTLKRIIELEPENIEAYYNVACVYARMNRINESINWLMLAIERGFDDWDLLKTDQDLTSIRACKDYQKIIENH